MAFIFTRGPSPVLTMNMLSKATKGILVTVAATTTSSSFRTLRPCSAAFTSTAPAVRRRQQQDQVEQPFTIQQASMNTATVPLRQNQTQAMAPRPSPTSSAPEDFGASKGTPISNLATICDEIDQALGVSKPPDIEVILTDHLAYTANPLSKFLHLNLMRFGHIAIRYTTSDGVSRVMNIMGDFDDPKANMVNFVAPNEYCYGVDGFDSYAQQGGVYNRPFVGVRIEKVSPGATDAMHKYFEALQAASEIGGSTGMIGHAPPGSSNRGAVRFQLVEVNLSKIARALPSPFDKLLYGIADKIRAADDARKRTQKRIMPETPKLVKEGMEEMDRSMMDVRHSLYNSGNCAQWSSGGLDFVGLIRRARLFPKAILVDLFEDEVLSNKRPNNVHVVYYDEVMHAKKADPDYKFLKSAMVHPLKPIRNLFYHDMSKFASIIVKVPEGSTQAIVETQKPIRYPGNWLRIVSGVFIYLPAGIMAGLIQQIGPLGPTAAAVWLFANWWLY